MSQGKIIRHLDFVIAKYPEMFAALEEYDRTHRLRKINFKERANFTIDSNLLNEFREYCRKNGMKMSAKIEQFIEEEISEKTKKDIEEARKQIKQGKFKTLDQVKKELGI